MRIARFKHVAVKGLKINSPDRLEGHKASITNGLFPPLAEGLTRSYRLETAPAGPQMNTADTDRLVDTEGWEKQDPSRHDTTETVNKGVAGRRSVLVLSLPKVLLMLLQLFFLLVVYKWGQANQKYPFVELSKCIQKLCIYLEIYTETLYIFLHLATMYSSTLGKGWEGRGLFVLYSYACPLAAFSLRELTCMHRAYLALWTRKVLCRFFLCAL